MEHKEKKNKAQQEHVDWPNKGNPTDCDTEGRAGETIQGWADNHN